MLGRATIIALALLGCVIVVEADASTIQVPSEQPTIQAGIDAASVGDTVLVAPGTYVENILIELDIVVRSEDGPEVTVIDGSSPSDPDLGSVVSISVGTLEGFQITGGSGTLHPTVGALRLGGGVFVQRGNGPLITNNWIHGNTVVFDGSVVGGGVALQFGSVNIVSNRIYSNTIEGLSGDMSLGAAIDIFHSAEDPISELIDNEIFDNHVLTPVGNILVRGAVSAADALVRGNMIACNEGVVNSALEAKGVIENNTIACNFSFTLDRAVSLAGGNDLLVEFRANDVSLNIGLGVECFQREVPPFYTYAFECNNIWGNTPGGQVAGDCEDAIGQDGNISVDPDYGQEFPPWVAGSVCLSEGSALLPENSPPGCALIGALGVCEPIGVEEPGPSSPSRFRALPARPNPFTERTTIPFYLAEGAAVEVWIYNVLGRRLRTLSPAWLFAGNHTLEWDGRDDDGARAASGAYVARIRAGGRELTRTLLLVR